MDWRDRVAIYSLRDLTRLASDPHLRGAFNAWDDRTPQSYLATFTAQGRRLQAFTAGWVAAREFFAPTEEARNGGDVHDEGKAELAGGQRAPGAEGQ